MAHKCRTNPDTGLPQISEARILDVAKILSEDIGYRIVGTEEHAQGDAWMVDQARAFKDECDALAQSQGRALECEVWHQTGDGSHRCVDLGAGVAISLIVRVCTQVRYHGAPRVQDVPRAVEYHCPGVIRHGCEQGTCCPGELAFG